MVKQLCKITVERNVMTNTKRIVLVILITVAVAVTSVVVHKWVLGGSPVWIGGAISGAVGGLVALLFRGENANPTK